MSVARPLFHGGRRKLQIQENFVSNRSWFLLNVCSMDLGANVALGERHLSCPRNVRHVSFKEGEIDSEKTDSIAKEGLKKLLFDLPTSFGTGKRRDLDMKELKEIGEPLVGRLAALSKQLWSSKCRELDLHSIHAKSRNIPGSNIGEVLQRAYHCDMQQSNGATLDNRESALPGEAATGLGEAISEENATHEWETRTSTYQGHNAHASVRQEPVGLFGYAELKTAAGFRRMAEEAVARSEAMIDQLRTLPPSAGTIRLLDDISDTVCTVLDAAELCRNTHSDREYVSAANEAFVLLSRYVQSLNTSAELYGALRAAMASGAELSEEAERVGALLRMDFERGGVHLPDDRRSYVEELNNEITRLGMEFGHNISSDQSFIDIYPSSKLRAVPENIKAMLKPLWNEPGGTVQGLPGGVARGRPRKGQVAGYRVGFQSVVFSGLLKWVPDPEVRRQVYVAGHSTPKENLTVLNRLIEARHELAQVLGHNSYAEFQTGPLLAGSPERVVAFLEKLSAQLRPKADQELQLLAEYKRVHEGMPAGNTTVNAWDTAFYTGLAKARAHSLDARVVAAYFPLERCVEGLGLLVRSLFGMEMRQLAMPPGEAWAPDVQKYTLEHPDEGVMGHMYLDIYPRPSKYTHAAHFTLKCGRRLSDSSYQLPVSALVCNFPRPLGGGPCLLGQNELETLFHEFGHTLHSLLSRTEFQHLSGTRAALDFVETPSNLFEYFVGDYRVLKQFARHYSTGDVIPERLVANLRHSKTMFAARDLQSQVIFALGDQVLFGRQPLAGGTTAELAAHSDRHTSVRPVAGTHWEARFSHLIGYGAGYYSYLYARCFAAQIWHSHFAENPLSTEMGTRLRLQMLRHGGARDPSLILQDLLPDSVPRNGNECKEGIDAIPRNGNGNGSRGVEPCTAQLLTEAGIQP